jgi:RNA recognition motif-containing protein
MEDDLELLFMRYRPEWVQIWCDMKTGESKGFGFVEIPDDWNAERAMNELNWSEYRGKRLKVSKARARVDRA